MTGSNHWTADQIPDQNGRIVIVTGGNSGLGFETVKALTRKRAFVILACRTPAKGVAARDRIVKEIPEAQIEVMQLDLASLHSVKQFAQIFNRDYPQLHILINNAGVMATPYSRTVDGFELQFGTNHLGHFALTGWLMEVLLKTDSSRVVTVTSLAVVIGRIKFDDLMSEKSYERWLAYSQSKLANLLFAYELERKLRSVHAPTISLAAHPGISESNLRSDLLNRDTPLIHRLQGYLWELFTQDVEMGVLPQLYAATAPGAEGGEFYAPGGLFQRVGFPRKSRSTRQSYDEPLARKLWAVSEELTGVRFKLLDTPESDIT